MSQPTAQEIDAEFRRIDEADIIQRCIRIAAMKRKLNEDKYQSERSFLESSIQSEREIIDILAEELLGIREKYENA